VVVEEPKIDINGANRREQAVRVVGNGVGWIEIMALLHIFGFVNHIQGFCHPIEELPPIILCDPMSIHPLLYRTPA